MEEEEREESYFWKKVSLKQFLALLYAKQKQDVFRVPSKGGGGGALCLEKFLFLESLNIQAYSREYRSSLVLAVN